MRRFRWTMAAAATALVMGIGVTVAPAEPAAASEKQARAGLAAGPIHTEKIIFDGGGGEKLNGISYHSFRIPSLIRTNSDTLIAFVEGRHRSPDDFGNINLLYKRSTDNGATWSKLSEVVGAGEGTWGNPTAVVDRSNNKIWLFMNHQGVGHSPVNSWDDRQVFVSSSSDDGRSWTTPRNMSSTLKPKKLPNGKSFNWDAVGPGVGIQTRYDHPGRLVIPALHRNIYSDDHGRTWKVQMLRTTSGQSMLQGNEATVLELKNGQLYRNERPASRDTKRRLVATGSIEHGFTPYRQAGCLLEPNNEGSTMRYNYDSPGRIAFLNSASTVTRQKMRIRMSEDEGRTWSYSRALSDAPLPLAGGNYREGGYSSMVKTANYRVGMLVEVNENVKSNSTSHRSIAFRTVNLPWVKAGQSEPGCAGGINPALGSTGGRAPIWGRVAR